VVRRLFWTSLGATVGVVAVRKLTRTAQSYTPEGVAQGLAGIGDGLREMAAVVREAMAQRDAELRLALGIDEGVVDPRAAQDLIERPTGDHPGFGRSAPTTGATGGASAQRPTGARAPRG
jgi:hypothetical protein